MLLQRSAASLWQSARKQLPRLPKCPYEGMSEPAYAALLFVKYCTFCGMSATSRPDVYLGVRLCASCRNAELVELNPKLQDRYSVLYDLVTCAQDYRPDRERTDSSIRMSRYALRSEVEEVAEERAEYLRKRERKELAKYDERRRKMLEEKYRRLYKLYCFMKEMSEDREKERDAIKAGRREIVTERLKALGWTDEYMIFDHAHARPWRELAEAPKPLTEKVWVNILPKLTALLEENSERIDAYNAKKRRVKRRARVDQFMTDMKYKEHPYAALLAAVGAPVPEPPQQDEDDDNHGMLWFLRNHDKRMEIANPFPKPGVVFQWELLSDLDQQDISLDEVDRRLEERKVAIMDQVADWRTSVEERLVGRREGEEQDTTVLVKGSTDLTAHLPQNTRLLLRADVLFKHTREIPLDRHSFAGKPVYYPDCVSSIMDRLDESPRHATFTPKSDVNLDQLVRHPEAERVVKQILRDLGMPDVARLELEVMGCGFVCNRCSRGKAMRWTDMIRHYHWSLSFYEHGKNNNSEYPLRHPVIFRNVHDLEQSTPLVRLATEQEKAKGEDFSSYGNMLCHLCQGTGRKIDEMNREDLSKHMKDWHLVEKLVQGVHYGVRNYQYQNPGAEWNKLWDTYHDEKETEATLSKIEPLQADENE